MERIGLTDKISNLHRDTAGIQISIPMDNVKYDPTTQECDSAGNTQQLECDFTAPYYQIPYMYTGHPNFACNFYGAAHYGEPQYPPYLHGMQPMYAPAQLNYPPAHFGYVIP